MKRDADIIIEGAEEELSFKTSRSSGAGGQHVNKVETRVTLSWDVRESKVLSNFQKNIIEQRLSNHVNKEGVLLISDQSSRSQVRNKESVVRKWRHLIQKAFYVPKVRKSTRVPSAIKKARLENKKRRSALKVHRRRPRFED